MNDGNVSNEDWTDDNDQVAVVWTDSSRLEKMCFSGNLDLSVAQSNNNPYDFF